MAQYLLRRLEQIGIEHLFGVPGDFSLAMLDVIERTPTLKWVGTSSELGAAYAADGYARANGLGALFTTFGVGELSAINGVAGSMAEQVGVLHVVGAPSTAAMAEGASLHHTFADGDLHRFARIAAEVTDTQMIVAADSAAEDIDDALVGLLSRRMPVYLLLPQDLVQTHVSALGLEKPLRPNDPAAEYLAEAGALVLAYFEQYPHGVALAGHLLARWNRATEMAALWQQRGIRVATLPNSKSIIDAHHPTYLGVYNGKLSSGRIREYVESDAGRVLVGCTLSDTTTGGLSHNFSTENTLILTNDGVRWGNREARVPFSTAVDVLMDIWPRNDAIDVDKDEPKLPRRSAQDADLTQNALWALIADALPGGHRLFADTGTSHYGALDIDLPADTIFESAPVWSAIGYSLPAAIGSSIAEPSRRSVVVIGDGAAQMVAQELAVIGRETLSPVIVLVNNHGYTVERVIRGAQASYNDLPEWDWELLPPAYGLNSTKMVSIRCTDENAFSMALGRAFQDDARAYFIVVETAVMDAPPTLAIMAKMLREKADRAAGEFK